MATKKSDSPYVWCAHCGAKVLKIYHRCKKDREAQAKLPDVYSSVSTAAPVNTVNKPVKPKPSRREYMRQYMKAKRAKRGG